MNNVDEAENKDKFKRTKQSYRVLLTAEDWSITDLYEFPHAFDQCYSFIYCLDSERTEEELAYIDQAFRSYPWRGGYSYVNIYLVMANHVPWRYRPTLKAMKKGSPGFIDFYLLKQVAVELAKAVAALAGSAVTVAKTYTSVKKILAEVKADREKARNRHLAAKVEQLQSMMKLTDAMAKHIGFKNVKELHERTGSPEVSLKLISAHYRRLSTLADFVLEEKAVLPLNADGIATVKDDGDWD